MTPAPRPLPAPPPCDTHLGFPRPIYEAACLIACEPERPASPDEWLEVSMPPCRMLLQPVANRHGTWAASAVVVASRPEGGSLWHHLLLDANLKLMQHGCISFGLDAHDRIALNGQLFAGLQGDPLRAARQLQRLYDVWRSARAALEAIAHSPLSYVDLASIADPASIGHADADAEVSDGPAACLLDNLLELGFDAQRACEIAAAGRVHINGTDICFEAGASGRTLLLHIGLGHGLLDGTGESALRMSAQLMTAHGIAVGRCERGHRLVAHWPCGERPGFVFDACLATLADLPQVLVGDMTLRDWTDTDLNALLPQL